MNTLLLIAGASVVAIVVAIAALRLMLRTSYEKAKAEARAEKAERDANVQKGYAEIATKPRDSESTAGLLDEGKF